MSNGLGDILQALQKAGVYAPSMLEAESLLSRPAKNGPDILFFTGGSALRDVASTLSSHTSNTVHVVTTFDSGGSSAELRRCFNMPAIGDIRYRIDALADITQPGVQDACIFFERRLHKNKQADELVTELAALAEGMHPWCSKLLPVFKDVFTGQLSYFCSVMPADFNLAGASLGNLILAADYLHGGRSLLSTVKNFSSLLSVRGHILPVCEKSLHLAVELDSGKVITGQHRFTGKSEFAGDCKCLPGPLDGERVKNLFFYSSEGGNKTDADCAKEVRSAVSAAHLVCYPIGSFFSSLLATVSTTGAGQAICGSPAKKVYVPNPGPDPESTDLTMLEQLQFLRACVLKDSSAASKAALNYLLVDSNNGEYAGGIPYQWCHDNGISVIDCQHVQNGGCFPVVNPARLSLILYFLALSSN